MSITEAVRILKSGGVIAFPTETVFGIGAALYQPKAISRIFKIKKRPRRKPLQVLVASLAEAKKMGRFSREAEKFAKKHWPGPYTLIVYAKKTSDDAHRRLFRQTIGLRIPDHQTILKLIRAVGPIAATSANSSGHPPALTTKQAREYVGEKVDFVLPGRTKHGKASRVIDAVKGLKVLRR
jgi:L-threonylcarbamoyladenylate synthase